MKRIVWIAGLVLWPLVAIAQPEEGAEPKELKPSPISYESVQEAFDALSADPELTQSEYQGWTVFSARVEGVYVIWSFTPEGHPVHPSAVKREIVSRDGELLIAMSVLCHSNRPDCDLLVQQYEELNEDIKRRYVPGSDS